MSPRLAVGEMNESQHLGPQWWPWPTPHVPLSLAPGPAASQAATSLVTSFSSLHDAEGSQERKHGAAAFVGCGGVGRSLVALGGVVFGGFPGSSFCPHLVSAAIPSCEPGSCRGQGPLWTWL